MFLDLSISVSQCICIIFMFCWSGYSLSLQCKGGEEIIYFINTDKQITDMLVYPKGPNKKWSNGT